VSARAWALFAAVSTLWGIPYLFIKIAINGGVPPIVLAWGRLVIGAAILLALAWKSGVLRDLRGRWRFIVAYGVIEVTIPFPLIASGEQHVASSLTAIIIASVPLIVALLALKFDHAERVSGTRFAGLLIGLLGVGLLVGLETSGSTASLLAAAGILVAAVGYACGPLILKRTLNDLDPRATMGTSLAVGALALTPLALLDLPARAPTAGALASVGALGLVCTALAFVLMAMLIREAGAGRAVVITYVNPIIAVALGVALLGEQPGAGGIAGLLLILVGCWLATDGRLPRGLAWAFRRSAAAPLASGEESGAPEVVDHLGVAPLGAVAPDSQYS
jgi:drug/metabolite transporter (DMT)-like permease